MFIFFPRQVLKFECAFRLVLLFHIWLLCHLLAICLLLLCPQNSVFTQFLLPLVVLCSGVILQNRCAVPLSPCLVFLFFSSSLTENNFWVYQTLELCLVEYGIHLFFLSFSKVVLWTLHTEIFLKTYSACWTIKLRVWEVPIPSIDTVLRGARLKCWHGGQAGEIRCSFIWEDPKPALVLCTALFVFGALIKYVSGSFLFFFYFTFIIWMYHLKPSDLGSRMIR